MGERYWAEYDDPGVLTGWGSGMGWVLRLVETGVEGSGGSVDVMAIDCLGELGDIADLGLTRASSLWLWSNRQSSRAGTPTAAVSFLRSRVPDQGLPPSPDRHPVRSGRAPATPPPLRWLRRRGGGARLADTLPLDARTRSGPGAVFRRHAVPGRRRCARTPSADRCRDRLRWLGLSEQNFRLMSGATAGVRLPRSA